MPDTLSSGTSTRRYYIKNKEIVTKALHLCYTAISVHNLCTKTFRPHREVRDKGRLYVIRTRSVMLVIES